MTKIKDPFRERTSHGGSVQQTYNKVALRITNRVWYRTGGISTLYTFLNSNLKDPLRRSLNEKAK